MTKINQTPEQIARDEIDARLAAAGWSVQPNKAIDHTLAKGVAIREYQTSIGPADYVLFGEKRALGVVGRGVATVPIFLLVPQVKLRKRLDLARDAERAVDGVPGLIVANWV